MASRKLGDAGSDAPQFTWKLEMPHNVVSPTNRMKTTSPPSAVDAGSRGASTRSNSVTSTSASSMAVARYPNTWPGPLAR